jgi:hypothetical protein
MYIQSSAFAAARRHRLIDFFSQQARPFESHHTSRPQCNRLTRLRIPPPPLVLLLHRELPKSTDHDIFTVLQWLLDQLEQSLDDLGWLAFGE